MDADTYEIGDGVDNSLQCHAEQKTIINLKYTLQLHKCGGNGGTLGGCQHHRALGTREVGVLGKGQCRGRKGGLEGGKEWDLAGVLRTSRVRESKEEQRDSSQLWRGIISEQLKAQNGCRGGL
ncbi:hypothetical protein CRENBAI_006462 [Crenichthys baileyi]|uniref:Uncharacterized protein n=1 Tax=Crenichthys baileyi TaxID=28760 RepID=A0AAV9RDY3_9TELE